MLVRLLLKVVKKTVAAYSNQVKKGEKMEKLFFNGEFTSKGNFRGEDIYQFLDDLEYKMEMKEVTVMDSRDFLDRHLSVTAKTMVKSVKDFDEASSKLIKIYGEPMAIITRALIEAEEEITPEWCHLQTP